MKREQIIEREDINKALEYIKSKHNGEIPYKYGSNECAKLMATYAKEYTDRYYKLWEIFGNFCKAINDQSRNETPTNVGVSAGDVYKALFYRNRFEKGNDVHIGDLKFKRTPQQTFNWIESNLLTPTTSIESEQGKKCKHKNKTWVGMFFICEDCGETF